MRTHYEVFSRSALLAGISAYILIIRVLFKLSTINSFNVLNIWTNFRSFQFLHFYEGQIDNPYIQRPIHALYGNCL